MKTNSRVRRMNPLLGVLVTECETTSAKVRAKLGDPYSWCFCDLCGRLTEYAIAIETRKVFKRGTRGAATAVPLTNVIRDMAQRKADELVKRYERALSGEYGPYEPGRMLATYCKVREMGKDWSVPSFRDQVERMALQAAWALHGDTLSATLLPGQKEGESKPSKFYCERHNPSRSIEARRAYQRDRRLSGEYKELMSMIWTNGVGRLPPGDIEAHSYVRTEAYRLLHIMRSTKDLIAAELEKGITNQSEIARKLNIEHRQTVSIAIKRCGLKMKNKDNT